ncbi:MAG: rhomboid family intramembrane serine protease [Planctomycetaceae bacterium]
MGLENRDYVRDDEGYDGWEHQPRRRSQMSMLTKVIIVTVAVYFLQLMTGRPGGTSLIQSFLEASPSSIFQQGQIWRVLTYAFCHDEGKITHIALNMLALYSLGQWVVDRLGDREFLWFYLTSAIFAGLCSIAFYSFMNTNVHVVGASGAVLAVFMLFVMYNPRQTLLLMGIVPVEARWLLAAFVAFDVYPMIDQLTGGSGGSTIAHSAHVGGLLFGYLYFRWHMHLSSWWDRFAGRLQQRRKPKTNLRVFSPGTQPEVDVADKVDELLKKISEQGEASLTAKERNFLTQASKQMRKGK